MKRFRKNSCKPRILFFIHLPPPIHGAAIAGQTLKESEYLKAHINAEFLNLSASLTLSDIGKISFKKILRLINLNIVGVYRLWRGRFEAVVFSPSSSFAGLLKESPLYLSARFLRKSRIFQFHSKGLSRYRYSPWLKWFLNTLFSGGHAIILSERLRGDVNEWFNHKRVHIQPCGIPDIIAPRRRDHDECIRFLFLGNLIVSKGVVVAIQAAAALKKRGFDFELLIVGAGSSKLLSALEKIITERGLQDIVFIKGPLYKKEKEQVLADSDVLIFPTYYTKETFGIVNLEAMKYGLPVISTDNGGIADVVIEGETGFMVPFRDPVALSDKMERFILSPELGRQMGMAGRKRFKERFTVRHYEEGITEILEKRLRL